MGQKHLENGGSTAWGTKAADTSHKETPQTAWSVLHNVSLTWVSIAHYRAGEYEHISISRSNWMQPNCSGTLALFPCWGEEYISIIPSYFSEANASLFRLCLGSGLVQCKDFKAAVRGLNLS